jgi:hypothetical protein
MNKPIQTSAPKQKHLTSLVLTMAATGILDADGVLRCNLVTCYKLTGAAADVFKQCIQGLDAGGEPSVFLMQVWHEVRASKHVNRLSVDEHTLLLVEVAVAAVVELSLSTRIMYVACRFLQLH